MLKKILRLIILILAIVGFGLGGYFSQTNQSGQVLGQYLNASSTDLRLMFFDVGQGDSELIITPSGKKILVDGGPNKSIINKLDENLGLADRYIDYVILSHPHADHVAGLPEVLRRYKVGQIITNGAIHTAPDYLDFLRLIKEKNIPTMIIDKPQELVIDGATFQFLAPLESFLEKRPESLNDSSIVFRLVYGSTSAMFMGDFEDEEKLISSSTLLKSDLIKIGHHGSTNANDKDFLFAVNPKYAIISVGKDNSFGHPHYRTVYQIKQLGAEIFRTDEQGDIVFKSDGIKFSVQ